MGTLLIQASVEQIILMAYAFLTPCGSKQEEMLCTVS
jgi:hypothetical protein